jgi:signal transduction histidine kinase
MKWFRAKYTYTLIVISLIVSTGLQVIWLQQLFLAQRKQLATEIENIVSNAAQTNLYYSLASLENIGNHRQMKALFLSPQWQQIRQAYDDMKMYGLNTTFQIDLRGDSTYVTMGFTLKDTPAKKKRTVAPELVGLSPAQILKFDTIALPRMEKNVGISLRQAGITSKIYHAIYSDSGNTVLKSDFPKTLNAAYISKGYNYNFKHRFKYHLIVPSIDAVIWYRMRYYVMSSFIMILFTCTAFYFILRLLRNQRLYADAKADFTSNMTHEFKTPIATVAVALESITRYKLINDPETLQNYLDISQYELQRLNLMVEKVLNISKQNDGDHPLNLVLYEVQSGLQQVISSMQLQLLDSNATIRLYPSAEPCFVYGDPVHLTNVFYNLIDNAIKYAGNLLDLQINCEYQDDQVVISFKDNGPGIEKIYQESVFERFFRIPEDGDTHNIKGSGLGLHYVQQMVEKHGGVIKLKSEPGKGSNFMITLPKAI